MLSKIALLDPEDRDKFAGHLNALIQKSIAQHTLAAEPRHLKAEDERWVQHLRALNQRRHDNPPGLVDDLPMTEPLTNIAEQRGEAAHDLEEPRPTRARLVRIATALLNTAKAIAAYCGALVDTALNEGTKALGMAGGTVLLGDRVMKHEQIQVFTRGLLAFARTAGGQTPFQLAPNTPFPIPLSPIFARFAEHIPHINSVEQRCAQLQSQPSSPS